jgi:hypothetical protein
MLYCALARIVIDVRRPFVCDAALLIMGYTPRRYQYAGSRDNKERTVDKAPHFQTNVSCCVVVVVVVLGPGRRAWSFGRLSTIGALRSVRRPHAPNVRRDRSFCRRVQAQAGVVCCSPWPRNYTQRIYMRSSKAYIRASPGARPRLRRLRGGDAPVPSAQQVDEISRAALQGDDAVF